MIMTDRGGEATIHSFYHFMFEIVSVNEQLIVYTLKQKEKKSFYIMCVSTVVR